ncbi:MAG: hypothetical protein COB30_003670 [Ectothiorhodospiraceae bacterium]|nr:hypothetical protein [Ectothiorhodospiraceae bacterium]
MTTLKLFILTCSTLATCTVYGATPEEIRKDFEQIPGINIPAIPGIDDIIRANPPQEEADVEKYTSGAHFFKQALTSTKPRITSSEKFITLPGAQTRIRVPAGTNALVNVALTAESSCSERYSTAPNWCEVRILVDGVEAAPAASSYPPDTFAFDSTDSGSETSTSWEAHAMDRHRCVFNASNTTDKVVPVEVQWRVTNFDGANAPQFWLDDYSLTIQLAKGCEKKQIKLTN